MSRLAIVSFPVLGEADREWIESMRKQHDPLAPQLAVHVTFVFPLKAGAGDLTNQAKSAAATAQPFQFEVDRAEATRDAAGGANIFLVLREGGDRIIELHDRLYTGALQSHLRTDIPYVPHLTIGKTSDFAAGDQLARELTMRSRGIRGAIETIELLHIDASGITSTATFSLGRG